MTFDATSCDAITPVKAALGKLTGGTGSPKAARWLHGLSCAALALIVLAGEANLTIASAQDTAPSPAPARGKHGKSAAGPAAGPAQNQAAPAKDPVQATKAYNVGVTAYQQGKHEAAIQAMNEALQGGLPNNLVAKALYYRGASFGQQHKPGQAISDLTSALWLNGGLDAKERAEALRERTAAYREAGLADPGDPGTAAGPQPEPSQASGSQSVKETTVKASGFGTGVGDFFTNLFGGNAQGKSAPAPAAAPQPPAPAAPAASAALPAAAPTPAAPPPVAVAAGPRTEPEILPWATSSHRTVNATTATPSPVAERPPEHPPAAHAHAAAAKHAAKGVFRIQVATAQSRDAANGVVQSLQGKGELLASAHVTVDEAKFGATTFFRVRLGPYATAADTKAPCEALKAAGLDCLVTAR